MPAPTLFVCNNHEHAFTDRYNGVDYVLHPGETVEMPVDAARHIFGYGETNPTRALVRQGLMKTESDRERAQEWLDGFRFEERSVDAPDLAQRKRRTPKRDADANPSGDLADADRTPPGE